MRLEDRQIQLLQHRSMFEIIQVHVETTVKPLTATIAPFGINAAASSAVRIGYVLFLAIVSTSLELRRTPLKKGPDTLLIIGAVINPAPYCLNPLESFRGNRMRFAEDTQLLFQ